MRETDIATRYGGEEFVVILPEMSKQDARAVAAKIRETLASTAIEGAQKKGHDQCGGGHPRARWEQFGRTNWQSRSGRLSSQT